ncbi:MAG: DUF445 domain-containing protein [Actinomycetota bacterium]
MSLVGPDVDAERAADLRRMKWRATGLLLAATALFVVMRITTDGSGWSGYVEAAAEAAMVGGVADWFAVTALFRHPLRLPIPHTAIIPNRKDQIGASLGTFVQDNFLNDELVGERIRHFGPAGRLGSWLEEPANARRLGDQLPAVLGAITEVVDDDDVGTAVGGALRSRLESVELAPLLAGGLDVAIDNGQHQAAFESLMRSINRIVTENEAVLRKRLYEESPWWVPEAIDDRVFDRIVTGVRRLVADVLADPDHELRRLADERIRRFAVDLRSSPDLHDRAEALKAELLDHPEVRAWLDSAWRHVKEAMVAGAEDPDSDLRRRLEEALMSTGQSLRRDAAMREKLDRWTEDVARYLVNQSQGEVADLIATTVARWDAQQTGERIELQVGRDLQFIRINGTVVGGLVGLLIHGVAQLL